MEVKMEIYNEDLEKQDLSKMTVLMQLVTRKTAKNLNNIFTNKISLNYLEEYYLNNKVFLDVISWNKVN